MGAFLNRGNEEFLESVNSEIYIDKTDMIAFLNQRVNTEGKYICVSRPRRFGKTMTANMIAAYYEKGCDSRGLFENRKLAHVDDKEKWDRYLNCFDVIRIDIAGLLAEHGTALKALKALERGVVQELREAYPICSVDETESLVSALTKINDQTKNRFIIIIDEWECFFRDCKNDIKVQKQYIDLLRTLFKDNRSKKFLALGYITGILPIKRYKSESALNNFDEYTMTSPANLAEYIGFTSDEVEGLCEAYDMNIDEVMEWYNGYNFDECTHIYGPNSIVKAMQRKKCENFWSRTSSFSSLASYITMNFDGLKDAIVQLLAGQRIKVRVNTFENDMISFRRSDDILTMLIHLGYLGYDSLTKEVYIPNKEVQEIFEDNIDNTGWNDVIETLNESEELLEATLVGEEKIVAECIERCHDRNTSVLQYNNENSLACVISLAYYTARKDYVIVREMPRGKGFADLVFLPKKNVDMPVMVIELKWEKSADTALNQIREKNYPDELQGINGEILLVGINYEKEQGEISKKHSCRIERIYIENN